MTLIAQLTDLHLSDFQENPHGIDVWANFDWALESIIKKQPSLLVISGDICFDRGYLPTYEKVKSRLSQTNIPYRVIPGNHDDSTMMANVFELEVEANKLKPWIDKFGNVLIGFLDSGDYTINLAHLKYVLDHACSLVFVHHPVVRGASLFMDSHHALINIQEVEDYLRSFDEQDEKISFFHGHYHTECKLVESRKEFHISPSTYYAIETSCINHQVAHTNPGYRTIEFSDAGQLVTRCFYKN